MENQIICTAHWSIGFKQLVLLFSKTTSVILCYKLEPVYIGQANVGVLGFIGIDNCCIMR